jgi:hypothetical protein
MTENIYSLLSKVMSEVGAVEKSNRNSQQNYSFRGIDDLYAALHGPLVKNGIFFCTDVEKIDRSEKESKGGSLLTCTVLTCKFTFFAPDGTSISVRTVGESMDSGDKSCSKAMSTALKYALLQLFCIPTSEPKDSEYDSPAPVYNKNPKAIEQDNTQVSQEDWENVKTIGKQNRWPENYMNYWIKEERKKGKAAIEIYQEALDKFGKINDKVEVEI